jgi:cation transport regulator ChaB
MFKTIADLPEPIREHIPDEKLQKIYLDTYRKSWDDYEEFRGGEAGREAVAHRDAMNAVKKDHVYDKENGQWYPKGEKPDHNDEEEDPGLVESITDTLNL